METKFVRMPKGLFVSESFDVRGTRYKDAITFKYDNRRITVISKKGYFMLSTRNVTIDNKPLASHKRLKGKVTETNVKFSREGAELLMLGLADILGCEIILKREQ